MASAADGANTELVCDLKLNHLSTVSWLHCLQLLTWDWIHDPDVCDGAWHAEAEPQVLPEAVSYPVDSGTAPWEQVVVADGDWLNLFISEEGASAELKNNTTVGDLAFWSDSDWPCILLPEALGDCLRVALASLAAIDED